jgi:hypothetical protein
VYSFSATKNGTMSTTTSAVRDGVSVMKACRRPRRDSCRSYSRCSIRHACVLRFSAESYRTWRDAVHDHHVRIRQFMMASEVKDMDYRA